MSGGRAIDPAFQGVGQKIGTEIWRIENFQPVAVPKCDRGKFYSGDSYIVLQTSAKGTAFQYDIHFWLGKATSLDESGTAAIKAVELDAALGGRAVQHREVQGYESDKFLSYFKPCIIPLEGGFASGFKKPEENEYESRLFTCKGRRVVKMKQVPFARSSLNHDDVFILDTATKIYQFNGANSSIQERAKALEVVQYLKDAYHEGSCDVAVVDDGKLDTESDSGEFWVLFGGFAPISKKVVSEDEGILQRATPKLYSISDGEVKLAECELSKGSFENNKCYLLDCGDEVHIWVGRLTQVEERKVAIQSAEDFMSSEKKSKSVRISRNIQGYESSSFKSNFESWPAGSANPVADEGRGKVAALLKQQGVKKGATKSVQASEELPPLLEKGGKIEVWLINGSAKTSLPKEDVGKFHSGDCYIVLYTYHSSDKKEDYLLCCWFGSKSVETDQETCFRLCNAMFNSLKGRPVQGRVYEGHEPPQFIALFDHMLILKGGLSSGYKEHIAEKGLPDETYNNDGVALFCISGTSAHNNKTIQVDAVAISLNSSDCFLLQSGSTMYTWHGNQSTAAQQQLAAKIADFLKPGVTLKHAKEGTESSSFWLPLGGKQNIGNKKLPAEVIRDPHLFAFSFNQGKFQVEEIHNFSQDDLLPEDILILETHVEVFIWVGQCVDSKEKQNAFNIGQKYIETAVSLEGISPFCPLYKITEGNEPAFFTTFFSWDPIKASVPGNSFQKKMALLFGSGNHVTEEKSNRQEGPTQRASALAALNSAFNSPAKPSSSDRSNGSNSGGPTQRASALAALSSAFNSSPETKTPPRRLSGSGQQASQRAAAVAALSNVLTAEKQKQTRSPNGSPSRSPSETSLTGDTKSEVTAEILDPEEVSSISESNEDTENGTQSQTCSPKSFTYDQLKTHSPNPALGIDHKRREAYLSADEFETIFGTTKDSFYKLPKWKQDMLKRNLDLF